MVKGTLKWTETIIREIEISELHSVIDEVLQTKPPCVDMTIETDLNGKYSVTYKELTEPWTDA